MTFLTDYEDNDKFGFIDQHRRPIPGGAVYFGEPNEPAQTSFFAELGAVATVRQRERIFDPPPPPPMYEEVVEPDYDNALVILDHRPNYAQALKMRPSHLFYFKYRLQVFWLVVLAIAGLTR